MGLNDAADDEKRIRKNERVACFAPPLRSASVERACRNHVDCEYARLSLKKKKKNIYWMINISEN